MQNTTRQFGQIQEQHAANYLQQQGLRLIESNYQCKMGEIDLIMQDNDYLVFVEVRYRKPKGYGDGLESITKYKKRKIIRTAQYYLLTHKEHNDKACRFDVIGVEPSLKQQKITWLKDAFWVQF